MDFIMNIVGYPLGWVMWAAYQVVNNYWVSLIIFTFLMRFLLVPMSVKQQKNAAHMASFKPKVDAIQKKYAKNPQKAQEEVNKLYEREGYNPFSGCSSLFLQLPIIYGLIDVVYRPMTHIARISADVVNKAYDALVNAGIKIDNALSKEITIIEHAADNENLLVKVMGNEAYEKIADIDLDFLGFSLGEYPGFVWAPIVIIPILSLVTSLASSFISMKMGPEQQGQGKGCMMFMLFGMPLMSTYFSTVVPAGVGLYWIIGNIFACGQTIVLKKIITPEKVAAQIERDRARGKIKKKSRLMSKLNQAQSDAAAQQGAFSENERKAALAKQQMEEERERKLSLSEQEKLAEARRKYAEKYGDDI